MEEDILEQVGLSKNEAKVYFSLLKIGTASVSRISEVSKVHRTNVYDALDRLMQKGLVTITTSSKVKQFCAASPDRLHTFVNDKKRMLDSIMPKLKMLSEETTTGEQTLILRGVQGVRSILDDALQEKKDIFAYGLNKNANKVLSPFMDWFHKERIEQKQNLQVIYDADAQVRMREVKKLSFTKVKYQPQKKFSVMATIIFGDKVALWTWQEPIFVVSIESPIMAESFRRNFKIFWDIAK